MLNKKDPLIDAIKQVMQNNQADRDAVKAVNEKFGIQDRRVLPHERQGEWDAAYKTVLTEGVEKLSSAQKHHMDVDDDNDIDSNDLKMKRMGMKEEGDPNKAIPGDTVTGGSSVTPVPKPKPTSITPEQQNALTNKIKSIKEAKKASMCESNNEGFNNRRDLSVTASAGKQVVADQLNEEDIDSYENRMTAGLGGFTPYGGGRPLGASLGISAVPGGRVKASNINTRTGEPFKVKNAPGLSRASVAKFRKTLNAKMDAGGSRGKSGNVLKKPVAKAKAGKAAKDARVARVKAVSRPAKKVDSAAASPKLGTPSGTFAANLQRARQQAQANRVAVNTSTATQAKPAATAATQAKPTVTTTLPKPGSGGVKRSVNKSAVKIAAPVAAGAAAAGAAYMYGQQDNAPATAVAKPKSKGEGELGAGAYERVPQNSGVMSMPNIRPTTALAAPAVTGPGTSQAAAKAPTSYTAKKGDTVWGMAKKDIQSKRAQAVASVPDAGQGEISRARATGVSNRDTLSRTNELLKSNQMTDQSARKMQIGKVVKTD
jgi:LysM repeat protein